ncbi:MAG: hypothetical protein RJA35_1041 [Actinomycetota bacterium]|jgi:thiamine biosynthesis lipoprotein
MDFETQYQSTADRFAYAAAAMGTVFVFQGANTQGDATMRSQCDQAMEIIHEADRTFSLYKPESPLSKLARGETSVAKCPPVVGQIWDDCEAWEKTTDGWFSAFTPEHTFDPSGLVKTWAARAAARYLEDAGITDFSLNAGGDIWISKGVTAPRDLRVGLSKPVSIASESSGVLVVLDLADTDYRAVCTSGSAERGEHIWNPKNPGETTKELVQVSVVARDLVQADVWATAAYARGAESIRQIDSHNLQHPEASIQMLAVFPDGNLAATAGFEALLARD